MSITYVGTRYAGDTGTATTIGCPGDGPGGVSTFGCRVMQCTVDFGSAQANNAKTSIVGVEWVGVRPPHRPIAQCVGRPMPLAGLPFLNDEDALTDQIQAIVTNIVGGVSFDVLAFAPNGANGIYAIQIMGV